MYMQFLWGLLGDFLLIFFFILIFLVMRIPQKISLNPLQGQIRIALMSVMMLTLILLLRKEEGDVVEEEQEEEADQQPHGVEEGLEGLVPGKWSHQLLHNHTRAMMTLTLAINCPPLYRIVHLAFI